MKTSTRDRDYHAPYSASGAHRWLECPLAVPLAKGALSTSGPEAKEGTRIGEIAENCLRRGTDTPRGEDQRLQVYLDAVRGLASCDPEARIIPEADVTDEVTELLGLQYKGLVGGRADVVIECPTLAHTWVLDLKWGEGIEVQAVDNPQLAYYGLAARPDWTLGLGIVQPRMDWEPVKLWATRSAEGLRADWAPKFRMAIDRSLAPLPKGVPGDHCKWCAGAAKCLALRQEVLALIPDDLRPPIPDPATSPVADLLPLLPYESRIAGWYKMARARVAQELAAGKDAPGWKLVQGYGRRVWSESQVAVMCDTALLVEGTDPTVPWTITAAEAALGRKWVDQWTEVRPGKPTLVPTTDKRPALVGLDAIPSDNLLEAE